MVLMEQLYSSTLWGISGIIIGTIASAIFFVLSKKKTLLEYKIVSTQLIAKEITSIPNLKVTIDGQSAEGLVSTTIRFINSGNQIISSFDFANKAPLSITTTDHLYGIDVFSDNPNSIPSIQPFDDKTYYIAFDFLKPKQSFSVTLLHSGKLSIFGELKTGRMRER